MTTGLKHVDRAELYRWGGDRDIIAGDTGAAIAVDLGGSRCCRQRRSPQKLVAGSALRIIHARAALSDERTTVVQHDTHYCFHW